LRLHSGQKPYACDLRPAKTPPLFVEFKLHKRWQTKRSYTCVERGCQKKFISTSGLFSHWKTTNCRQHVRIEEDYEDLP
jgi:hypothetical protein